MNGPQADAAAMPSSSEGGSIVPPMQHALNVTCKAALRLSKLLQHKETAARKWEEYTAQMKQQFIKERQKFERDMEKLTSDIRTQSRSEGGGRGGHYGCSAAKFSPKCQFSRTGDPTTAAHLSPYDSGGEDRCTCGDSIGASGAYGAGAGVGRRPISSPGPTCNSNATGLYLFLGIVVFQHRVVPADLPRYRKRHDSPSWSLPSTCRHRCWEDAAWEKNCRTTVLDRPCSEQFPLFGARDEILAVSFLHCFQAVGQTGAPGAFDDHREAIEGGVVALFDFVPEKHGHVQGVALEDIGVLVCFIGGGSVARPLQEGARRVDFFGQPPEVVSDIVFAAWPASPSPCSPFWVPSSCPLKTLAL
ncbi:unnamed protein product [Symbiodinium necroappetens]|uniref:Uncharacterized protein n=1 Tax=Symbiodinium necroappetens TaxID=1628268 RepID=A0A813ADJ7_9DINO|nr:unnamed protein product [Symbiodinium necroappetens]